MMEFLTRELVHTIRSCVSMYHRADFSSQLSGNDMGVWPSVAHKSGPAIVRHAILETNSMGKKRTSVC